MNAKDVCFDSRHRKDWYEIKWDEIPCIEENVDYSYLIPSADAHFAGPVTSKMGHRILG